MFIDYEKTAAEKLQELKRKGFFRDYPVISQLVKEPPYGLNHKTGERVIIFGNNNYLGLSCNGQIMKAKIDAIDQYGAGSSGTRNILGTSKPLAELENKIAKWQGKPAALSFISALDANIGTLSAMGKNFGDVVFLSDEKNHASIIDGIKLSGAAKYIFKHNDLTDLEGRLNEIRSASDSRTIIIAVESLYSMDGDFCKLLEIVKLKEKYNALLFVDEVHANGLYGDKGGGYVQKLGLENKVDIICGTFAKAMGVTGGFVCTSRNMIEFIRHHARNFIFTTSPAPDVAAACIKAVEVVSNQKGQYLRKKLFENVKYLKLKLSENNIEYLDNGSQIVPIVFGDEKLTSRIAKTLLEDYHFAVTPIFYPTVAVGSARIRVNVTPHHTKEMIEKLVGAIVEIVNNVETSNVKNVAENDNFCDKESVSKLEV